MEYVSPDLLTREEILSTLTERKLQIPNAEQVPLETLKQTYKNFVLPLHQRHDINKHKLMQTKHKPDVNLKSTNVTDNMDVDIETHEMPPLEHILGKRVQEVETIAIVCVKRPFDCSIEEHINTSKKRVKINWS